jgi:tetratricopeptide (TPR) repeat protein
VQNGESKADGDKAPAFVLEEGRRLSESLVWRLQREAYSGLGSKAWVSEKVPWFVTSNAFIAKAYALVVLGFLRDLLAGEPNTTGLRIESPVYVIELAAGSGHFTYQFLSRIRALRRALPQLGRVPLRYVMTDLAPANLEAWRANERLKSFVDEGMLDFALFDVERDRTLSLLGSGETLAPGGIANPLVLVANYAFDTTSQDAFFVKDGVLLEGLVTTSSSQAGDEGLRDPEVVKRLSTRYEQRPVADGYYEEPALNRVLAVYRERLGNTAFLFPIGALHGLRTLVELSGGRLLLISGDKGYAREDEIQGREEPKMALHGRCFSMMVNYHAIGLYLREQGGFALHAPNRDTHFKVSAFVLGGPEEAFPETRLAYEEAAAGFAPYDYFTLLHNLRKENAAPSLETILALLRLSAWDYHVVLYFANAIIEKAKAAASPLRLDLLCALEQVEARYYPMDRDLPFEIGRILGALDRPLEALRRYLESLKLFGEHHATLFNAALCCYRLERPKEALDLLKRSLKLKPGYAPARDWRNRIEAELRDLR